MLVYANKRQSTAWRILVKNWIEWNILAERFIYNECPFASISDKSSFIDKKENDTLSNLDKLFQNKLKVYNNIAREKCQRLKKQKWWDYELDISLAI